MSLESLLLEAAEIISRDLRKAKKSIPKRVKGCEISYPDIITLHIDLPLMGTYNIGETNRVKFDIDLVVPKNETELPG